MDFLAPEGLRLVEDFAAQAVMTFAADAQLDNPSDGSRRRAPTATILLQAGEERLSWSAVQRALRQRKKLTGILAESDGGRIPGGYSTFTG